ncbi:hypothetical protein CSOJ01_08794 [Colletotrichum sojae]|uniref:Uncharacterized protein n=1 Tax=Colletotrichum sojae TaxID=2175907 RepID=A0A8H6J513_9PEZI|nr:hypothetical protein CSOJ01_08794 [Colletotrichum sojae]
MRRRGTEEELDTASAPSENEKTLSRALADASGSAHLVHSGPAEDNLELLSHRNSKHFDISPANDFPSFLILAHVEEPGNSGCAIKDECALCAENSTLGHTACVNITRSDEKILAGLQLAPESKPSVSVLDAVRSGSRITIYKWRFVDSAEIINDDLAGISYRRAMDANYDQTVLWEDGVLLDGF